MSNETYKSYSDCATKLNQHTDWRSHFGILFKQSQFIKMIAFSKNRIGSAIALQIGDRTRKLVSCYEFRLHNNFAENCVTRGLSPLPVCVLDKEQLIRDRVSLFQDWDDAIADKI